MKAIAKNTYLLLMFMAYVMRGAGTFSLEDKVKMIEFLSHMALNPDTHDHFFTISYPVGSVIT